MQTTRWGVVGLGRAGQARIAAIAARPHTALAGTVGRRGGGTTTLAALCADPAVDGVMVCSENAHHFEAAQAALGAGKHVIVEFPLAGSAAEAAALYALARAGGRVLHCELIGLLGGRHRALRARVGEVAVASLSMQFTGRLYRWVADEAAAGRWGRLAVARLHALWDLFGPLTLLDARCTTGVGYHLTAELVAGETRLVLDERRGPGLGRGSSIEGRLADGRPLDMPAAPPVEGLFGLDLDAALTRIATGDRRGAYVTDEVVVAVLALAEAIDARAAQGAP